MTQYPDDRKNSGYSIRFIKALLNADAIREWGSDVVLLTIFIASREDKLHHSKPPAFWRGELMDRLGKASPKDFIRIRNRSVEAGLLHHVPGTRTQPGLYWSMVPKWLAPAFEAFRKGNGKTSNRSQNGTGNGTGKGTGKGTLSIPYTHNPLDGARNKKTSSKKFTKPTVQEVQAYCLERKNSVNAQHWIDHYESNGWKVGRNPMRDWKAAVRTWERNGMNNQSNKARQEADYPTLQGRKRNGT